MTQVLSERDLEKLRNGERLGETREMFIRRLIAEEEGNRIYHKHERRSWGV